MKNKKILSLILVITMIALTFSAFLCLPPMTAAAATIEVTTTADIGTGSLRAAITAAQAGDVITFSKTAFPETAETAIVLNTALPFITKDNVTIQGHVQTSGTNAGKPAVSIERSTAVGTSEFRILTVDPGTDSKVTLSGLKIANGKMSDSGGGMYSSGSVTAENCTFTNNTTAWDGGGVYASGAVIFTNSTFTDNTAADRGGGMYAGGSIALTNGTFAGNRAVNYGGGVYSLRKAKIENSTFTSNTTAGYGGGIRSIGFATTANSIFTGNTAGISGGGVDCSDSFVAVNSVFTKNQSDSYYGAVDAFFDTYLYHCTIAGNTGSGIFVDKDSNAKVYAYNSIIAGNSAGQVGYGMESFTPLALSGGSSLIEGINGVTYARVFGTNTPDAKGILSPGALGQADKTATALTSSALTGSGLNDMTVLASDLEGAPRSTTGAVNYGAVEKTENTAFFPVSKITISGAPANMKIGASATLKAAVEPANATNKAVTWQSSNTSIATVNASGKVTAKAPGTVTIAVTAKDGSGVTDTCKIAVLPLVSKIVITGAPAGMLKWAKASLKVTVTPTNAGDKSVTWSSSNPKIATVDQNGKVSAVNYGTVTITAKAKDGSGVKASCKIVVSAYITMKLGSTTMIWNGTKTTVDNVGTKPFTVSSRTMIPVRSCMEKFGAKVKYVNDSQPIVIEYNGMRLELKLNSKTMKLTKDNKTTNITIDVPAQKIGAKTYLPLRAVSQAFGFDVYYDNASKYIVINSENMTAALKTERMAEAKKVIK